MAKTVDNGSNPDYDVATGAGAVSDDVQRVTLASDDPAVAKLGTIDTDTGNIATSVATIAGAVSGTEMQVDVLTMPTVAVTGTFYQATQPVSAAALPLPTGASTLAEQQSQTTHLSTIAGSVDGVEGLLTVLTGAVSGTEVQVDVLTMPTTTVQDGGGSLSVDDNAGSLTVDAPVGTPVFVRLSDGAAAITTLPVSLASVPSHAVTNAGTFVTQENGAALTALQLIDDAIVADDAAFTPATTKVMMAGFEYDDSTPDSVNEGDAGAARMSANRNVYVQIRDAAGNERGLNVDASGNVAVTQSGTWNITNVSGTVSLPTGASTLAEQQSQTTHLSNIATSVGTLDNAIAGSEMQVDVVGALPAGTNNIGDVDVLSVVPGTSATSLGKAVDAVAGASDTGVAVLAIRDDSLSTLTPADGDYVPLRVSSTGALHVTGGGGGTQYQEDTAHTTGDTGTMALAVRKDTAAALATTDGDYTPLITDANGALHVAVASGSVTASGTISVDTITTSVVPGTSATHLGKAEDAAHASGDTGVAVWGVRNDSAATSFGANGDYTPLATDANGRVGITDLGGAISVDDNGSSLTVDNAGTFAVQAASAGDTAHDSADSGNPVKVGAKAANALPTAVANGDRANAIADLFGRILTAHIDPAMQVHKVVNVTTQQTGSDVWSPASGKKIAVTSVVIGSYGTTAGRVILWFGDNADTTYSAGTDQVLVAASFAPSASAKPGLVYTPAVPVFCTTADRELHLTTDAAISLDITVEGYEW